MINYMANKIEIVNKFNIGETVYLLYEDRVIKAVVTRLDINCKIENKVVYITSEEIQYSIITDTGTTIHRNESRIAKTKADLLKQL